jgi:CubicO group peptidase (beta-lactamase class C family)
LFSFALFAQKKGHAKKPVHVAHSAGVAKQKSTDVQRSLRITQREEAAQSLVVLKNTSHLLPLSRLDTLKVLVVSIGMGEGNLMPQMISRYMNADHLTVDLKSRPSSIRQNLSATVNYNLVIVAIGESSSLSAGKETNGNLMDAVSAEVDARSMAVLEKLLTSDFAPGTRMVFMLFGSQGFLSHWSAMERPAALVLAGKSDFDRTDLSAQLIFGAIPSSGKLPFDLDKYKKGEGLSLPSIGRLSYVLPEEVGIDSVKLSQRMDSLVGIGLNARAFPGCQMLLAKNGKIFYQKSYGFHTYNKTTAVCDDDLYDLASVTKVLAPVPALMMLADQKKFIVTKKMSDYWPDWKGSNKEGILVADLLSHQARLKPGVTLWPRTLDEQGRFKTEYYASQPTPGYDLRVSDGLYLIDSYPDTVYKAIRDSPLLKSKKYAYSDLGFVILPKVIEKLSGESYETFLHDKLYAKLGASSLMYHPSLTEPKAKIVPTEDDRLFRHELLQGYVHDETAALLGGVSGNAGLFGSVGDVAKVMQLYLQNGTYGDERYISAETLKNWTSSHFQKTNNRRGFGFDKPGIQTSIHTGKEKYPSTVVSEQSYGHSGYTGTFVWVDPANQLLFVFLSNRVFPDRENHKINKLKLRPLLLENLFRLAGEPKNGR